MLSLVGLLLTMALVLALRASTQSPYENLQAFPSIGKSVVDRAHPLIPRKSGHIEVVDAQQSDDDDDDDGVDIDVAEQFSLSPSLDQGLWGAILALRDMYEGPTVDDDARPFRTDSAEAWMQAGGNATEPACRSAFLSCFSTPDLAKWDAYERWNRFVHYKDVMEEHRHYLVNHGRYVRSKEPDSCPFVDKSANDLGAEPPALPHRLSPLAVHAEAAVATYYRHRAVSDDGTEPEFQPLYGPAIAPFGRSKPMPPMPPSSFAEKHGFHGGDLQQSGEGGMRFNGTAVYEKVLRTLCPGVLCGIPVEVSGFAYYPPGAFREWHTNRLDVIAREMRHDEKAGAKESVVLKHPSEYSYRAYLIYTTSAGNEASWFSTFKNGRLRVWPDTYKPAVEDVGGLIRIFRLPNVASSKELEVFPPGKGGALTAPWHCIASATHRYSLGLAFNASTAKRVIEGLRAAKKAEAEEDSASLVFSV